MSTLGMVELLFAAIALVMAGLGLSLELADFRRIFNEKRAVVAAVALQMVVLPLAALGLAKVMSLPTPYAVGMMLLAAAPGSISSNLYSHVFGGSVALTVSLTGLNTMLSIVTLPLMCSWALQHFAVGPETLTPVTLKLLQTMAVMVVPVVLGMLVRARAPQFAERLDKPVRWLSVAVLVAFSVGAIVKEWTTLTQAFTQLGVSVVLFNLLSLAAGYLVSHSLALGQTTSIAMAFHLGVRSAVLSIYIAITTLGDVQMALPAAVYSITMVILGLSFGIWMKRRANRSGLSRGRTHGVGRSVGATSATLPDPEK